MILPATHLYSLLLLVLGFLCWGSWANTFNATGKKWRFELYYFDFALGVMVAAILCAATIGSLGWDGFSFLDDIRLAGKRQDFFALAAGMIFNLGNMLLVASISVVGMAVAFPVGVGLSLVIGTIWSFALGPAASLGFRIGGMAALLVAVIVGIATYQAYAKAKLIAAIQTGKTKSTKKVVSLKGAALGIAAGVFLGSFYPFVDMARSSEVGLGPYSLGFVFAFGILTSTFVFNLFFMNLPVVGKPIDVIEYFQAKAKLHGYGIVGGMVFYAGLLATFVVARAEGPARIDPSLFYALTEGGVVLAVVWGLLLWKELSGPDPKVNYQVVLMLVFLLLGIGLLSAAPAFGPKQG